MEDENKTEKEPKNIDYHLNKISKKICLNETQIDELKEIAKRFKNKREEIKNEAKIDHDIKIVSALKELENIKESIKSIKIKQPKYEKKLLNLHNSLQKQESSKMEKKIENNEKKNQINLIKSESLAFYNEIKDEETNLDETLKKTRKITNELIKIEAQNLSNEIKDTQTADLCIMVDLTGSMIPWLEKAKQTLINIINQTKNIFGSSLIRSAFVGYRDYEDQKRFEIVDFSKDVDQIKLKLNRIELIKGIDRCEDVNGALQMVLKLKWKSKNRFLFHVLDSPCHNKKYYIQDFFEKMKTIIVSDDKYPNGLPTDISFEDIFKKLIDKNILYVIAPLNNSTDTMIKKFRDHYYDLQKNKNGESFLFKTYDIDQSIENFMKATINTIVKTMTQKVYETVSKKPLKKNTEVASKLFIKEKGTSSLFSVKLISSEIPANSSGLNTKLNEYIFEVKELDIEKIIFENKPFACGTFNSAHRADVYLKDFSTEKKMVLKKPLKAPTNPKKYFYELLQINTITKQLAHIFTGKLEKIKQNLDIKKGISFIDMFIVKNKDKSDFYMLEPYLGTNFKKFTNNAFFCDSTYDIINQSLFAFSHWSYEYTNHRFMVTDLQGSETMLTDSTLNTINNYFEDYGDLGIKGIASFFSTHDCNKICHHLKLKPKKEIKNILKDILPKINVSKMEIECDNRFCQNDLKPGDKKFCKKCSEQIKKEKDQMTCLTCRKYFYFFPLEYTYQNIDLPIYCPKCLEDI